METILGVFAGMMFVGLVLALAGLAGTRRPRSRRADHDLFV
jgi:hypothetical protein